MNQITAIHCHESPAFTGPADRLQPPPAPPEPRETLQERQTKGGFFLETKSRQKRGVTVPFLARLSGCRKSSSCIIDGCKSASPDMQKERGGGGWWAGEGRGGGELLTCLVGDAKTEKHTSFWLLSSTVILTSWGQAVCVEACGVIGKSSIP